MINELDKNYQQRVGTRRRNKLTKNTTETFVLLGKDYCLTFVKVLNAIYNKQLVSEKSSRCVFN